MFGQILAVAWQPWRAHIDLLLRNRHLHGQYVFRIEPRVDAQQARHALDRQPGAAKHHQRQGHLRNHQYVTQPVAAAYGSTSFLQRLIHAPAQRAESRGNAEQHAGQS